MGRFLARTVAVASGKGGVGKTNVVRNLVAEIASRFLDRPAGDVKGTLQSFIENLFPAEAGVR